MGPGRFVSTSFRTIKITTGVGAVIGKLKSDPKGATHTQSFIFDKKRFDTKEKVRKWLKDNGKDEGLDKEEAYVPLDDARIEYIGPDRDYPDAKVWKVTALTVSVSGNKRKYTKEELSEAAFTLSYRPVDLDHISTRVDSNLILPYPENSTGMMHFDADRNAILGTVRIADPEVNVKIESGRIRHVSVSQMSNEMCADAVCNEKLQYGIAFTRLALLENTAPGDPNTSITKMESVLISDLLDGDSGNSVKSASAAEEIMPKSKDEDEHLAEDLLIEKWNIDFKELWLAMTELIKEHPDWNYDQLHAATLEKLGREKTEASHGCLAGTHWCPDEGKCMPNKKDEATDATNTANNSSNTPNAGETHNMPADDPKPKDEGKGKEGTPPPAADASGKNGNPPTAKNEALTLTAEQLKDITTGLATGFVNEFKNYEQKQLELLDKMLHKNEATGSSSMVDDSTVKARKEMMQKVESFFKIISDQVIGDISPAVWQINKLDYFQKWGRWLYGKPEQKEEAVTITSGAVAASIVPDILLLPGGRMMKPIRQYVDVQPAPPGTDTVTFNKLDTFAFGAITPGTEPTNPTQTLTPVTAAVALRGAVQSVSFPQIHDVPRLIQGINDSMALGAIDDEAKEVLTTAYDAITPSFWINGNTGADITDDDVAGMTFTPTALSIAAQKLEDEGVDTSPGRLALFLSPKAEREIRLHADLVRFVQQGDASITKRGIIDQLFGVDFVVTTAVKKKTNTTNNTWRNVLAVKGEAFGLGVADEVTLEATRRGELFQVKLSGFHRIKGAVKDQRRTVRISTAQ